MNSEIKTIKLRISDEKDKFFFKNFDTSGKECIYLFPVSDKYYKPNHENYYTRYNKTELENRFGFLMKNIGLGKVNVEIFDDKTKATERANSIIDEIRKGKSGGFLKDVYARFAALIDSSQLNIIAYLNFCSSPKSDTLVQELATKGIITYDNACAIMGITPPKRRYYSYWDQEQYSKEWCKHIDSKSIYLNAKLQYAVNQNKTEYYYDDKELCICCSSEIFKYYYYKKYRNVISLELFSDNDISAMELRIFNNSDIGSQAVTIDTMRQSGIIKIGKTKISLNDFKKVKNNIGDLNLPVFDNYDINSGIEILTSLLLYSRDNNSEHLDISALLRTLFDILNSKWEPELLNLWLTNSTSKIPQSAQFYLSISSHMNAATLYSLYQDLNWMDGKWISTDSFFEMLGIETNIFNADMLYPIDEYYGRDKFKGPNGNTLLFTQYKNRIHDVLIHGALLTFAVLGGIELAVSPDNKVRYIRLTELGKWYIDKKREFPKGKDLLSADKDFEYDDTTLLVRMVNEKSMYLAIAKDLLSPVSSTRFVIEPKSTTKGCNNKEDLKSRLGKIRDYFVKGDCPNFEVYSKRLLDRCDLVKQTKGGSTYQLYDVDPSHPELLELISSDPQIKKHTMRVEGYKLLIKKDFYPTFVSKLRAAGFILES